ncbi:hypothetical protein BP1258A_3997 [Burkholderia pseudomallei 1258a]|uniref:Uncharacterized protein n=2 Tax=Burkholderia pseudomallei TaxID=28450 RepID=A0A0H3HZH9_BURP2|nr:hypothetical protein BURPS668_A1655 [Burkholderia pseudomallei 668]ABN94450.1 hypothetical protein BURPS1106A_A1573 [Burkholderia pseudomallei 1106a]AFI69495.1 hypothetical protein BP1026B_II1248 [Burkholderia pseudomallei 1026b]EBA45195.1 hypothetical protein BURPS305_0804 [Burkholderia pseudomallei 305]EDO87152.1 hypothetical protein BURPS406E_G0720 [Burkholderia pseudomallei 406e]EDO93620.1 hypothetical protein BURPSPAST_J0913 [Burkholderia pseudomallei Pasteur 52237]EDS82856.1 hypothet
MIAASCNNHITIRILLGSTGVMAGDPTAFVSRPTFGRQSRVSTMQSLGRNNYQI